MATVKTFAGRHRLRDRGDDLYETHPVATRALLCAENLPPCIWEPAAGFGAIVNVLRDAGHHVVATDLVDHGVNDQESGVDFLMEQRAPVGVQAIVTNPPYKLAAEFVRHGLKLVPKIYLLVRLQFLAAESRADILGGGLRVVHIFRRRLPMMNRHGWAGPRASSAVDHAWCAWDSYFLLGVASAVISNTRRVSAWSPWVEQPFLWIASVGLPSSGKTPALDPFHHACSKLQHAMRPDYEAALVEYRRKAEVAEAAKAAYQAELKAAAKEKTIPPPRPDNIDDPEEPRPPRVWIADSTIEELQAQLAANPRGLVLIRSELAAWLGQFERYGGGDSERGFYLECWDGRPFVVDRVKLQGKRLEIPFASLSIVGSVQPDKLASALQQANDGLIARLLFVYPDPVPPTRPTDPDGSAHRRVQIAEALTQLRSLEWDRDRMGNPVPRIIKLEPAAADLCQEFRVKNHEAIATGSPHLVLNGWRGKNDGRLLRIAAVLEFLEWALVGGTEPQTVSVTFVQRAWRYLSYCEEMFEHVLGDLAHTEAHRDAAQIARHIRDQRVRVVNERTLYRERGFRHLRDNDRRKAAFLELESAGWIRKNVGFKNGRPRSDWQAHPSVRCEVQIVAMPVKASNEGG